MDSYPYHLQSWIWILIILVAWSGSLSLLEMDLYNFLILSTMSLCRSWSLIPIIDIAGSAYLKFSELDLNLDTTIG